MESCLFLKKSLAQAIPQYLSCFLTSLGIIPKPAAFNWQMNLRYFPLPNLKNFSFLLHFCIFHIRVANCANLNKCNQFFQVCVWIWNASIVSPLPTVSANRTKLSKRCSTKDLPMILLCLPPTLWHAAKFVQHASLETKRYVLKISCVQSSQLEDLPHFNPYV